MTAITSNRLPGSPDEPRQRVADAAEEYWQLVLSEDAQLCATAGVPIRGLPRLGYDDAVRRADRVSRIMQPLTKLDADDLTGVDADTVRSLQFLSRNEAGAAEYFWQTPAGTPYQTHFKLARNRRDAFTAHLFSGPADVDRYLDLVAEYAKCFDATRQTISTQRELAIFIPRPAIPLAVAANSGLRDTAASTLTVADARTTQLSSGEASRLAQGVSALIEREVIPALDRLLALLDGPDYMAAAPEQVGMAARPGGEEAYRFLVHRYTSLDVTPEELHRLGLEQCELLTDRMRQVRLDLGFNMDEADFRRVLEAQPHLYATSAQEVERRYRRYMDRLDPIVREYFPVLQQAPYDVARLEPELEAGMTFGYYEVPSPHQPIGRYRYNGSRLNDRSMLNAAALIYHELVPGHHLQFSRQAENESLPDLRRHSREFGAFEEGWAEYASGLGWEMGLYADPWDAYGRLSHERFIATRLVVDPALNCGWWDLDTALGFMRTNISEAEGQLRSEAIRYSTDLPGQALGYRAGDLTIQQMRAEAERLLGTGFDIRDFHEVILSGGALPYTALQARLDRELVTAS